MAPKKTIDQYRKLLSDDRKLSLDLYRKLPVETIIEMRNYISERMSRQAMASLPRTYDILGKVMFEKIEAALPRYRNPGNDGQFWDGRSRQPRWMSNAIKKGKTKEDFLIAA